MQLFYILRQTMYKSQLTCNSVYNLFSFIICHGLRYNPISLKNYVVQYCHYTKCIYSDNLQRM